MAPNTCMKVLVFCFFFKGLKSAEQIWAKATEKVAHAHFERQVVLILDATNRVQNQNRQIFPDEYWDGVSEVMAKLGTKWSVLSGDLLYKKPEGEFVHFALGLTRAHQTVAVINQTTALDSNVLEKTIFFWRQHVVWFSRAKIFIIVEAPENVSMKIAETVFGEFWRQIKSVNVALFVSHGETGTFYAWAPYSNNCKVEPFIAGSWQSEAKYSFSIFPNYEFNNLHQCKIWAIPVILEPYVFPPDKHNNYRHGIEIKIFLALAEYLNFSFGYRSIPPGESPWAATINGAPAGLIGVLYRREADISLSGTRLSYERTELCDHVDSYYGDEYSWIGPTARRTPRWKAIFLVFRWRIWVCVTFTFIACLGLLTILYKFFDFDKPKKTFGSAFIVAWSIIMGSSVPSLYMTSRFLIRTFLAVLLFYVLILNTIYMSTLYKVLSKGLKQEPVHSALEALDAGMTASVFPSTMFELKEAVPKFYEKATANNLVELSEDYLACFRRAAFTRDCFTLYPRLGAQYFINMLYTSTSGRNYIRVFEDRYRAYQPVLYMSKHHPLLPVFRTKVKRLIESGWILKEVDNIMTSGWRKRATASLVGELAENEVRTVLEVDQILGAFLVSGILLILAIIAFFMEIYLNRKATHKVMKIVKKIKNMKRIKHSELLKDRIEWRLGHLYK